jgi:uncharacterized membrane protein YraQ (UPF0718 family)/copper chaperone CopZ
MMEILAACWFVLGAMAPYLLLGFLVAGVLSVVISPEWVERHLGGRRLGQVFTASLFGVPLPLCSCGVIPVAVSLRRHGAGKGATTAFLLSTPQTGVDSIAVTYGLLGPFLAVFRPVAALLTGFVGGSLVHLFAGDDQHQQGEAVGEAIGTSCDDDCCSPESRQRGPVRRALEYGLVTLPRDIGKALLVGIVISGAISAVVEANTLQAYLGTGLVPLLAAMLIGVPMYVCATASVPIALGLIHAGLSPGAALVFLITGPATNGAALATLWKALGRRTALLYLGTVIVCALASGLVVDALITAADIPASVFFSPGGEAHEAAHAGHEQMGWVQHGSAVVLLLVLAWALRPRRGAVQEETTMAAIELTISGMRCHGCVDSVTRALRESDGVTDVRVDLDSGRAVVEGTPDRASLVETVTALGFEAEATG